MPISGTYFFLFQLVGRGKQRELGVSETGLASDYKSRLLT